MPVAHRGQLGGVMAARVVPSPLELMTNRPPGNVAHYLPRTKRRSTGGRKDVGTRMNLMNGASLLLVSNRPAVRVFLENLGQSATPPFVVHPVPAAVDALAAHAAEV